MLSGRKESNQTNEPVTDCRPEPPCVVTDIPKREKVERMLRWPMKGRTFGPQNVLEILKCLMKGLTRGNVVNAYMNNMEHRSLQIA